MPIWHFLALNPGLAVFGNYAIARLEAEQNAALIAIHPDREAYRVDSFERCESARCAPLQEDGMQIQSSILPSDELDLLTRLRLLESVIIHARDAVMITEAEPIDDPGPVIRFVNPAFTRMTGYTSDEVVGRSPRLLQGPLSSPEAALRIHKALKAWKPVEEELLNYRKDGSLFWVQLSISPVADANGRFTHWISIQRDITERKAIEEAAALVRQTTRENEQLTEQIRERKIIEATLSHVAFHDSLTGLRNRIFFTDLLGTALKRAQSSRAYFAAVLFLDLDGFKAINDTLGHLAGDRFLKEIARRLQSCARVQDTVARLGGDEFILLLDHLHTLQDAMSIVNRVLKIVAHPFTLNGMQLQIGASIGLCEVSENYENAEQIMRDADTGMYRAKREGGARAVVFEESMRDTALNALRLSSDLRNALVENQFELYYQPLIRLGDSSVYGLEALIRWHHPTRGLVSPGDFIPIAEESGLICEMGRWVLAQAIQDVQESNHLYQRGLLLSVNVSSKQLDSESFLPELVEILQRSRYDPRLLQLEITENIFLHDPTRVGTLLLDIRALGVKVAFDDFGTGYSSISYLARYPVDMLKIDQWFVRNLDLGTSNVEVIQMMVRLAAVFGMVVAAEGVETEQQAETLIAAGCHFAQGYAYGEPAPMSLVAELLCA